MRKISLIFAALLCILYLFNPGMGIFEIIPDQLPVIGNIDEVGVTILLLRILRELGLFKAKPE